jgi:hypothetical protein
VRSGACDDAGTHRDRDAEQQMQSPEHGHVDLPEGLRRPPAGPYNRRTGFGARASHIPGPSRTNDLSRSTGRRSPKP